MSRVILSGHMKVLAILLVSVLVMLPVRAELIDGELGVFKLSTEVAGRKVEQNVYYCAPSRVKKTASVVIVMHGANRQPAKYRKPWVKYAKEEGVIVLLPEFSKQDFPGSRAYNLAGMLDAKGGLESREKWIYPMIDQLFLMVKKDQSLRTERFCLYGHSAGGQFVHRYAMFANSSRLGLAIAANAGWYTFPTKNEVLPYGVKGMGKRSFDQEKAFAAPLAVLLGSEDTDSQHSQLRRTKEAMRQGEHRFERGKSFYEAAKKEAAKKKAAWAWTQVIVPGVAHSNSGMSAAAQKLIKRAKF